MLEKMWVIQLYIIGGSVSWHNHFEKPFSIIL